MTKLISSSEGHPDGWPALQTRLLNELIYTARRIGDPSLTVRYEPCLYNDYIKKQTFRLMYQFKP